MKEQEFIDRLIPKLNKELIETLIEAAKVFGWQYYLNETWPFIRKLDELAKTGLTSREGPEPYVNTNKDYWD